MVDYISKPINRTELTEIPTSFYKGKLTAFATSKTTGCGLR